MPIHPIPKPHSSKFRLITNLSASEFVPNTMIDKAHVSNLPMMAYQNLVQPLLTFDACMATSNLSCGLNVSQAYHWMPIYERWQMKQIHTIDGQHHVDRCNNFGGKGGYGIWSTFMCLVVWIGWLIFTLHYWVYVDNNFRFECAEANVFHTCSGRCLPTQQAGVGRMPLHHWL